MVVFTNGCFDILHVGHIKLLEYCSTFGKVIVGLNSDESVRRIKGTNRPINSQTDRKLLLESIRFVDEVIIFEEDTPLQLIKRINPDFVVKGGDYKKNEVIGKEIAEVLIFPHDQIHSTTNLIDLLRRSSC